jgi:biopolymer transport protein ExbD
MSIKISCLQCGETHKVNDRLAGRRVRCPGCDTAVHVPELPEPVVPVKAPTAKAIDEAATDEDTAPNDSDLFADESVQVARSARDSTADVPAPVRAGSDDPPSDPPNPAVLVDDDGDDDVMQREQREEDELDMTPMVDVTFLLLIFFVVTASFQLQKSIMMPRQQTDAPSTSAVEEDPEELDQVELQIDERGTFLVLASDWEAETPGKQNLITKLKEANPGEVGAKLIIKVHEQCKLQALVDGMDAGTIAGYEELQVTQVEDFD